MNGTAADGPSEAEGDKTTSEEPQNLSELATDLFVAGKLGECLVVLEAAKTDGTLQKEDIERQKLVVQMHTSAQRKDWWKVCLSLSRRWQLVRYASKTRC